VQEVFVTDEALEHVTPRARYTRVMTANAISVLTHVRPGDIVLLHDPQTAGMALPLAEAGAQVVSHNC